MCLGHAVTRSAYALLILAASGSSTVATSQYQPACSILPPFTQGVRSDGLFVLAAALSDTILAGPGEIEPTGYEGHWGDGRERQIYGQLVQVKRHSAPSLSAFSEAAAHEPILVVPWDYDPGCRPTYWNRSAAWIEADLEGVYTLVLRPEALWIDARPVADAFAAGHMPYPHAPYLRAGYGGTKALRERPSLSAAEYFSLYSVLPTASEVRGASSAALARLQQWESQYPDLARRYPADQLISAAKHRLTQQH